LNEKKLYFISVPLRDGGIPSICSRGYISSFECRLYLHFLICAYRCITYGITYVVNYLLFSVGIVYNCSIGKYMEYQRDS